MGNYSPKTISSKVLHTINKSTVSFFLVSSVALIIVYYYIGWFLIDSTFLWARPFFLWEVKYGLNGSLFYIPIICSLIVYRNRFPVISWFVLLLVLIPRIVFFTYTPLFLLLNLLFISFPLILYMGFTIELNWRQKERNSLIERDRERQAFILESIKANENERRRIAQELHDDTIQTLVAVATGMQLISSDDTVRNNLEVAKNIEWSRDTLFRVVEDLRRLTLDLRPSVLDNMGLIPALRWLANNLCYKNQIVIQISVKGKVCTIAPENEVMLFRIVQEALNNIVKHSRANMAWVNLEFSGKKLDLLVRDNGCGFQVPEDTTVLTGSGKLGLAGIHERVISLGGVLNINSETGIGTTLSMQFLLSKIASNSRSNPALKK